MTLTLPKVLTAGKAFALFFFVLMIAAHGYAQDSNVVVLQEVIVTKNSPYNRVRNIEMGSETISAFEAKHLPAILGEVDIIKVLQLKPGIKSAGEGLAGFYVRGGGADQNLITLDGVPIYNPNHLLGLFSVFNNDAIKEVKLYKSGYPARYGGRLSSVLDVSMRPGSADSFSISGGTGLLSSRIAVEAPLIRGRSGIIVSARRTYFDVFTEMLNRKNKNKSDYQKIPGYYFTDFNLRADFKIDRHNSAWLTAYTGTDHFDSKADDFPATFNWGNRALSFNWKTILPSGTDITSSVFYSGYRYRLSNRYDYNDLEIRSSINTVGVSILASLPARNALRWQTGVSAMQHQLTVGDFNAVSSLTSLQSGEKNGGTEMAAFVHGEWDAGRRLAILGGARVSGFRTKEKMYVNFEPRVSARLSIGDNASLKAGYSRMYQYLHLASLSSVSLPVDVWYPSTASTRPQYSDQVSVGYSRSIAGTLYLSLETYYKWMNNQIEFRDGANLIGNPRLESDFIYGKGNAYGTEAYIEKKQGKTRGWIGYTLAWATRTFNEINDGRSFRPRYDRRHDVSVVLMHKINDRFSVSGNWIFGTGAYTTVPVGRFVMQSDVGVQSRSIIPVYGDRNNFQLKPVHRLDLNLVFLLPSKHGKQDITFSLYNAYSRRNPFYVQFAEVNDKEGYVTSIYPKVVSLFPVLPGISYNFSF